MVVLTTIAAIPSSIDNGYYTGRSGDIIVLNPAHSSNGFVSVVDPAQFLTAAEANEISELQLSGVVADILSIAPTESLPCVFHSDAFRKPQATFIATITGLDSQDAAHLPTSMANGNTVSLTSTSYPASPVSMATTISSGVSPAAHGIVQSQWLTNTGTATAFASGAGANAATLGDRMDAAFGACGGLISFSANSQLAIAYAARSDRAMGSAITLNKDVCFIVDSYVVVLSMQRTGFVRVRGQEIDGSVSIESVMDVIRAAGGMVELKGNEYVVSLPMLQPVSFSLDNAVNRRC